MVHILSYILSFINLGYSKISFKKKYLKKPKEKSILLKISFRVSYKSSLPHGFALKSGQFFEKFDVIYFKYYVWSMSFFLFLKASCFKYQW